MDSLDHCFCMFQVGKSSENDRERVEYTQTSGEIDESGSSTDGCQAERAGSAVRRVDLIVSPHKQFSFALLGWTGSKVL